MRQRACRKGRNLVAIDSRWKKRLKGCTIVGRGWCLEGRRVEFKHNEVIHVIDTIKVASAVACSEIVK